VRFRLLFCSCAGLVLATLAAPAFAQEPPISSDQAAPAPPRVDELPPPAAKPNTIVAGAVSAAAFYGAGVAASYLFPDAPGGRDLRIPVAGPWLSLRSTGCAKSDPGCGAGVIAIRALLTILDGVGQLGGLAVIGEGLFLNTSAQALPKAAGPTVRAVPLDFGTNGVGMGLSGTF
jgi:hypothetical protein